MAESKAWREIERFAKSKYPTCIKRILALSGYDNMMSLRAIDEKALTKLEEHVNQNRNILDGLECCFMDIYASQDVFKFMPGHKTAILDIPRQIDGVKSQPKKERKRKIKSLDEMQEMLISQLSRYPSKIGFVLPEGIITERNIIDVKSKKQADGSLTVDCGFSCPFCDKITVVTYKKFWQTSNATKHLKSHVNAHLERM